MKLIIVLPTEGILINFCCDAPFKLVNYIEQMRRSLPSALRRVAHFYNNNSIQQLFCALT